jgi:hypothetical protein
MNTSLLQLHLSQAKRSLGNSLNNNYLDPKKSKYQANLLRLLNCLESEDLGSMNATSKEVRKGFVDFIFNSIEYLDGSLFTTIPFELTYCLEQALEDWIPGGTGSYIITTALRPELFCFSLNSEADQFGQIKAIYGIDFEYDLIQISLSKYLAHDYLYNIVLYHELGHFIDRKHKISECLYLELMQGLTSGFNSEQLACYPLYFPDFFDASGSVKPDILNQPGMQGKVYYHFMEYFADVYAAQYVGTCSHEILRYLTYPSTTKSSASHPSPENRIMAVDDFLVSTPNYLIDRIAHFAKQRSGQDLRIRFSKIDQTDFFRLIPPIVSTEAELHGVFNGAWEVYKGNHDTFNTTNSLVDGFSMHEVYNIINNLAEKSIGNYVVKKSFDEQ